MRLSWQSRPWQTKACTKSGKDRSRGREPPVADAGLHESGKDRSRGREPPEAGAGLHESGGRSQVYVDSPMTPCVKSARFCINNSF